jgi:hypothetical protein
MGLAKAHPFSTLFLAQLPFGIQSGGEGFLTCFIFSPALTLNSEWIPLMGVFAGMSGCSHFCCY